MIDDYGSPHHNNDIWAGIIESINKKGDFNHPNTVLTEFYYNCNRINRLTALVWGILSSANASYFLRLQSSFLL